MNVSPRAYSDLGNAYRLADRHGDRLRYVHGRGHWLIWDDRRWKVDTDGGALRLAVDTIEHIPAEASRTTTERHGRHAVASQFRARINALLGVARNLEPFAINAVQLDADPMLLNVANGTLNLVSGELGEHDRSDLITKLAPIVYDREATCPRWLGFLEQILSGDQLLIDYLQLLIGYSLTGRVREHILPVLLGDGANGKSTFLGVLMALAGEYAWAAPPELLLATRDQQHPTIFADLQGHRLVVVAETDASRRLNDGQVKRLTGGDVIPARRMHQDFFDFVPSHTAWLATNHPPRIDGDDQGIWRRLKRIPFDVHIPPAMQDARLPDRLHAELPGILAWAIRGCLAWQNEGGLTDPPTVKTATDRYREQSDLIGPFLTECCTIADGRHAYAGELYAAYRQWAQRSGETLITQRELGLRLARRGLDNRQHGKARRTAWFGIGLDSP